MNFNQNTFFLTQNLPKIDSFAKIKTQGFRVINDEIAAKKEFTSKFGEEIPNNFLIQKLKHFIYNDIVLELGAGLGLWAAYLKEQKVKIFPSDISDNEAAFCSIYQSSAQKAVELIKTNCLFISHPPLNSQDFYEAIQRYQGEKLIFIENGVANCDKLLTEYIFRKFYIKEKYQLNGFGKTRHTMFLMKRK